MAGEIQLNSTTMATESSGSITAQLDVIRPNTTNGSLTLQGDSSDAGVTGLTIDSSGNVRADTFTDIAGTGAPAFPNGIEPAIIAFSGELATDITASGLTTWTYSATNKIDTESAESAGVYTIPKTGKYKLSVSALIDRPGTGTPASEYVEVSILKGASAIASTGSLGYYLYSINARANGFCEIIIDLTAGETIKVQSYHSTTGGSTYSGNVSRFNLLYLGS